jgi:hypothetical protein
VSVDRQEVRIVVVHWVAVISVGETLGIFLFIESFDCESCVVKIGLYCFHTTKPANALMLKLLCSHNLLQLYHVLICLDHLQAVTEHQYSVCTNTDIFLTTLKFVHKCL